MDNVKLAFAEAEDIAKVAILFDLYRQFYGQVSDLNGATNFLQTRLSRAESIIITAAVANKTVGFTQLYPLFSSVRMKPVYLLNDLFVDPSFRKQGIATQLIEKAKELCKSKGFAGISLETEKTNIQGNRLYPALGFELDVDHNFYHWSHED